MTRVLSPVLDVLFPPRCAKCGALSARHGALCAECWKTLHFITDPVCACCGHPFAHPMDEDALCAACMATPPPYARLRSLFRYDEFSKDLVLGLKYYDRTQLAPMLGRWLATMQPGMTKNVEMIVPVPLHPLRLLRRRYNQAALLASVLSAHTGVPVLLDALKRTRHTRPQAGLERRQRLVNVKGTFRINPKRKAELKQKTVLVVDDVTTTGATLAACAIALRRADVAEIRALTLARTVLD